MPAPATIAELLEVIEKSGLITEPPVQAEIQRLTVASPTLTVEQFTQLLVREGILTRFQAKQLKLGRHKRFEIAGKYRLLELLGVGGMGAVYLCEHMFMKRLVALKVLPIEKMGDPSALARFYREAQAVAAMDHPNIVRAYDIDKFESMHFLVMEYVDGTSIQEIVARHGPIAPERIANYAAQAALGLQHAHELGLVHRDIKPGNLLLERSGVIKILDMGLARFFDRKSDNLTEKFDQNCVLGTADYLAPEQAVTNVVDIRADIYALGGSMYFALTGQSPFPDGTIASKLMSHQTKEPKPITDFRDDVPQDILNIIQTMMRKDPDARYQTPAELYQALQPWLAIDATPLGQEMPELCPAVLSLAGYANSAISKPDTVPGAIPAVSSGKSGSKSGPQPGGIATKPKSRPPSPPARQPAAVPTRPVVPVSSEAATTTGRGSQTVPGIPIRPPVRATPPPPEPAVAVHSLDFSDHGTPIPTYRKPPPVKHAMPTWMIAVAAGIGLLALIIVVALFVL
ncbi:MAG: serine/threonine protein kinase [Bacteroidales bacterium]|nr:serine/threonine protein kinase [Bacteroidales bacterium]